MNPFYNSKLIYPKLVLNILAYIYIYIYLKTIYSILVFSLGKNLYIYTLPHWGNYSEKAEIRERETETEMGGGYIHGPKLKLPQ